MTLTHVAFVASALLIACVVALVVAGVAVVVTDRRAAAREPQWSPMELLAGRPPLRELPAGPSIRPKRVNASIRPIRSTQVFAPETVKALAVFDEKVSALIRQIEGGAIAATV